MKLLLAAPQLEGRGTPKTLANYARILRETFDIAIYGWDIGGETAIELKNEGFKVFVGRDELDNALDFKPDIFNLHRGGAWHEEEKSLLKAFKMQGAKCIETNVFGRYDSTVDELIDLSIQISWWDLFRWNRWKGDSRVSGVYLPNPVNTNEFKRALPSEIEAKRRSWGIDAIDDVFVIGRIGKTDWNYLYEPLIKLLEKYPFIRFVTVAGKGDCKQLHTHSQVVSQPIMRGAKELSLFYSACDVCVSISAMGESFGCANAEAMSCETPVIALSTPLRDNAQMEMVCNDVGGVVVGSMRDFSKAIEFMVDNIYKVKLMGRKSRELIVSRYSFDALRERIKEIFSFSRPRETLASENEYALNLVKENLSKVHKGFRGSCLLFFARMLHSYVGGMIVRFKHYLREMKRRCQK